MRILSLTGLSIALCLLVGRPGWAQEVGEQKSFTVLYTADIHDHLVPGKSGVGGLGSVATYVDSVRSQTETVFLVDAGDAAEKGDYLAYRHNGALTYRLMRDMGYDVLAIGNHEQNLGLDRVRELAEVAGGVFTSVNLLDEAGNLMFAPFRIIGTEDQRVAFIGASLPSRFTVQDIDQTAEVIRQYASLVRTHHDADVVVVVIHAGLEDMRAIGARNPEVDVFIGGHTHRNIETPVVLNESGSIAVQTAHYANFVGRLDFVYQDGDWTAANSLITMRHEEFPPDPKLLDVLKTETAKLDFDPGEVITATEEPVGFHTMARIASEAVREHYKADIAFIHPTFIARSIIHPGSVSANDIFKTLSDRGETLLEVKLTGADIEAYMNGLANRESSSFGFAGWGQTMAAGVKVGSSPSSKNLKGYKVKTNLGRDREYRVVMPVREWEYRFSRLMAEEGRPVPATMKLDGGTFAPMLAHVRGLASGQTLLGEAARLRTLYGSADPLEDETEAQILSRHQLGE
jgi:5'-nucleotidase/UDP-sugar diphosphatase